MKSVDTGQSEFYSNVHEFNRGLLGIGAAIPESIAILAKKLEDSFGGDKPLEDYQTYKWAKAADKWIKEAYPTNPAYQDELSTQLFSGAGQAVSFLSGGELASTVKLSRGASMAFMGAAQNAAPEYENAKQIAIDANLLTPELFVQKYATGEEDVQRRLSQYEQLRGQNPENVAWDAFKYNALIGTTEAIPFDIALTKLSKMTGGSIQKYLVTALEQGSTEAIQEASSQYMSNLAASEIYDKQREVTEGLLDAATPAFILGGVLGGFGSAIANRINDPNTPREDKAELLAAKDEIDAQLKSLPEDQDEIIAKPIESRKIKELVEKRDGLDKELITNKDLSDETKATLVKESQSLDAEIELEKELVVKEGINQSRIGADISALETRKKSLEEERSKMDKDAQWVIDAQLENIDSKLNDLKQQQNVETSQAQTPGEKAVRLLNETGSELNTEQIKKEVEELTPKSIQNEEKGKEEGLLTQETGVKETVAPVLNEGITNEIKPEANAIPEQATNEVPVQPTSGNSGKVATGISESGPEITSQKEEIVQEQAVGEPNIGNENKPQTKEEYINQKLALHFEDGDFEPGSEFEKVAREKYGSAYEKAKDVEDAMQYNFKAEEGDLDEAFLSGTPNEKGYTYKTKAGEYNVTKEGAELKITDRSGKAPSYSTKNRIIKDYEQKFDYNKGKRIADEDLGDIKPEEADRLVADKSENPAEIIEAYKRIQENEPTVKGDYIDQAISEGINKIKGSSYRQFGDKNNVTNGKARAYFNEKSGVGIDQLAQELSETSGVEITPEDVIGFIDRYPNGISDYTKSIKNPLLDDLKNRFKEVTGLNLSTRVSDAYEKYQKQETKFVDNTFNDYEQLRREYFEAIERGEIPAPEERTEMGIPLDEEIMAGESQERVVGTKREEKQREEVATPPPSLPTKKEEPKEPGGKKKKSFLNRVVDSKAVKENKDLQAKVEAKGLDYDVFTHKEAKSIAEGIIEAEGADKALAIAQDKNSNIAGGVRTAIYGKSLDNLYALQQEYKSQGQMAEYEVAVKEWADLAEELDDYLRDAGRAIASVGDYYKSNAIGIQMREVNRLKRDAKKELEKGKKYEKIKKAEKEFEKIDKEFQKKVKKKRQPSDKKNIFNRTAEEREAKIQELKDRWKKAAGGSLSSSGVGLNSEQIEIAVELGAEYLASGIHTFAKWSQKMVKELGITEEQAKLVWDTKAPKGIDSKQRTLAEISDQEFVEERNEEATKAKLKVLNKMFPKKKFESEKKRKELHEKIVEGYDAGLFEGGVNKEGKQFEELFYEKMGIVDPNKPAIQENIRKFAEKIHKAPEGSLLQKELYSELLTYLENEKRQSLVDTGMSLWYANILSSYETHLRNSQFNIGTSMIAEPLLLAEKRLLKGDVSGAIKVFSNLFRDMGDAARQAKAVWRGGVSKYEAPKAKSVLDRFEFGKGVAGTLLSPAKYPGRALRASDVFFTSMLANAKQYEALKRTVEKMNPELNKKQQEALVNEYLGNTTERVVAAENQAKEDVQKVFEVDPTDPKNKEANRNYKLRVAEIVEQTRPKEIYEEGVDWARRALLTNTPEGMWKGVAETLNTLGEAILPAKLVVPFVNVPLNLAARFIDRGPIGYVNAIRGHRGSGRFRQELTEDQRKELFVKATNYSVALVSLYFILDAINDNEDDDKNPLVITGKQTGDYLDNKGISRGGGMDEYSIYLNGNKVMSYKYTPWAPLFAPIGYIRDHVKYGESKGLSSNMAYAAMNYIGFVNDQAAMKGLGNFLGMLDERSIKNITAEKLGERLTSTAQNFIVPMSGLVKATNNDIRGIMGETDKVSTKWWDPIMKDVPLLEEMMEDRTDHLGRDVKEVFDAPLLPEAFAIKETNDPYYKLFNEKGYFPNFYTQKTIFIDNEEREMSKEDLYKLNQYRGKYAVEILNSEDMLPSDEEGDRTTLEYLKTLDNENFKKQMNIVFSKATAKAKMKMFGNKWAGKKYDLMSEDEIEAYEKFKEDLESAE